MCAMRVFLTTTLLLALVATCLPSAQATTCQTTPNFTDSCYHQYILYNVDTPNVDVLILPSASPYFLRDVQLFKQSIKAWDDGINALGPTWLASGITIHAYAVGLDDIPHEALWDPEIVVVPAEYNPALLFGIGEQVPVSWCHGVPPPIEAGVGVPGSDLVGNGPGLAERLAALPGFHQHDGSPWGTVSTTCSNGGATCFVVNTNFLDLFTPTNRRYMYDLNSHEFGHCLGIGHVGDALDFSATTYPRDDIMSYENDGWHPNYVLCVSTLDILGLEQVYGNLLGASGYPASPAGHYISQDPTNWSTTSCSNPTATPLDTVVVTGSDTYRHATNGDDTTCLVAALLSPPAQVPFALADCF
jgi:hypothetical protein